MMRFVSGSRSAPDWIRTGPRALRDLKRGIDRARFLVDDVTVTLNATGGALLGSMRALLEGSAGASVGESHDALILRMLGLPPADAAEVASRQLPAPAPRADKP